MRVATSSSNELNQVPGIVAETKLLRHFASEQGAYLIEREQYLKSERYFLAHAQAQGVAGFGRGSTKRMALVKAVAEFYERRFMNEAFLNELSHVPKFLQTSNGFAVHFSESLAIQSACNEAIERHLLQYSFLKDDWNGFEFIGDELCGEESLTFVASRYSVNGLRAGMVLATSHRFPGISFGYFVDQADKLASLPRWSHAIFEATNKIEPFLRLAQSSKASALLPIEQGILNWMMTPHKPLDFVKGGQVQALPDVTIEIKTFDLANRWNLDLPFFGAYSFSKDLLPLLVVDRILEGDLNLVHGILSSCGLPIKLPERNPVL